MSLPPNLPVNRIINKHCLMMIGSRARYVASVAVTITAGALLLFAMAVFMFSRASHWMEYPVVIMSCALVGYTFLAGHVILLTAVRKLWLAYVREAETNPEIELPEVPETIWGWLFRRMSASRK